MGNHQSIILQNRLLPLNLPTINELLYKHMILKHGMGISLSMISDENTPIGNEGVFNGKYGIYFVVE